MRYHLNWLRTHTFQAHVLALMLMVGPSVLLHVLAQRDATGWIWGALSLVVLGNLLELNIP